MKKILKKLLDVAILIKIEIFYIFYKQKTNIGDQIFCAYNLGIITNT